MDYDHVASRSRSRGMSISPVPARDHLRIELRLRSARRNLSFGRIDSRFLRAFSRLFIGGAKPRPHTPHLLVSNRATSLKYGGSWISQTNPALLPSGAITKASPRVARRCLEICVLAEGKTIRGDVLKNDETILDRCTSSAGNKRWPGRRCVLRLGVDSHWSSLRYIVHYSLPSTNHLLTSSSTENTRRGSDSNRLSSVYAFTSSGIAS
jgi:hypothetical protein